MNYYNKLRIDEFIKILEMKINNGIHIYEILEEIKINLLFKQLVDETVEYKNEINKYWIEKLDFIEEYIEEIVGEIKDIKGKVFITPKIYNIGEAKLITKETTIIYGTNNNNKDILVSHILHELLHNPILKYEDIMNIEKVEKLHAVICLIAEKEFLYRINQKPYWKGKSELENTIKKLYPFWIGYIYANKENAVVLIESALKRDRMYEFEARKIYDFSKRMKEMNVYEFIEIDFEKDYHKLKY